ncbi:NYN domain-containing protein [Methylobacterium sp. WL120]|uniref:NYN domain-containing protein n=1 Tax=Methylobacterium sp. WL120 TaxID=2603887 RepID=UPI0011C829FA|nr:NYN domain-containing protein [Methylobacterium sp. WL120]TXM57564.1 NYN domain-containing protein [Methylobacterium sp. WL120]
MADWIYVDNSNVFIEGKRVSAVKLGLAPDIWDAVQHRILDNDYRMSFGKLYEFVAGDNRAETARAMLFGSRPPENDAIWDIAKRAGFEVVTHDRNFANKEKKIDTGLVAALTRDAYRNAKRGDIFTIVSGDNDYVPAVQQLREDGFQVDVVFWSHVGKELRETASNFISLDAHLDSLRV